MLKKEGGSVGAEREAETAGKQPIGSGAVDHEQEALDAQREAIQIPEGWKPNEKGSRIRGIFRYAKRIKCQDKQGKERTPLVFFVDTEGGPLTLWGSANLQPQMEDALTAGLKVGDLILCEYDGEAVTSAGYKVKRYVLAVIPH